MEWQHYKIVMPGRIVEYFPEQQTATVKLSTDRVFSNTAASQEQTESGLLYDVPVHTAQGGAYALTMPITVGDTCLLLFSQFGYDHWLWLDKDSAGEFAGNPSPWQRRKFSLKDGLALVGFNPVPKAIPNYNATDAEFRNRDLDQFISLRDSGDIDIEGPASGSLTIATSYTIDIPQSTWTGNIDVVGDIDVTGEINMNANLITEVADPVSPQDVATRQWVINMFSQHSLDAQAHHS